MSSKQIDTSAIAEAFAELGRRTAVDTRTMGEVLGAFHRQMSEQITPAMVALSKAVTRSGIPELMATYEKPTDRTPDLG